MTNKPIKLIIQIPCLNEEGSLAQTIADLPTSIPGIDQIELLIIDDGSTDKTSEIARSLGVHHIVRFTRNRGLARAFTAGLNACLEHNADIIVNTDADGQYKGNDIEALVQPILKHKADIVIGNRDIEHVEQFSWFKKKLQRLGSSVVRRIAGSSIPDCTTGFRAYSREAAMRINILTDYTYTLESIIQSEYHNLAIENITIQTNPVHRPSRLFRNNYQYIKRSIITLIRVYVMYRPLKFFSTFGFLFTFLGIALGCRFIFFYLLFGGGGKIQSLILTAICIILGMLFFLFGLIADQISGNRKLLESILYNNKSKNHSPDNT